MTATASLTYKDLRGYLDAADKLGEMRVDNSKNDVLFPNRRLAGVKHLETRKPQSMDMN